MFASVPLVLAIPLWSSWWQFALSLFVWAGIYEMVRPANATAIAQLTTPENRARAFGLQRLAANLGFSFGPAIGGFLATYDFTLLFIADALTTCVAAGLLLYLFLHLGAKVVEEKSEADQELESPLRNTRFVLLLGLMLATQMVFMQFLSTYPLYLRDHFLLDKRQIGLIFAVNTSIIVLLEMVVLDFIKRWPAVRSIGWGCFICCLGFGMLPFGTSGYYCVLAMAVVTIGEMLSFPTSAAYVAQHSPKGKEGRYLGWYMVTHSVAWVMGPFLGSLVYEYDHDTLWIASLAVGGAVLAGFVRLELFKPRTESVYEETEAEQRTHCGAAQGE